MFKPRVFKRVVCLLSLACASGVMAQTVETIPFRAVLSPLNEVPPITGLDARGVGTIWVHIVRNAAGQIVSGSVDFQTSFRFGSPVNVTAYHVHNAPAGSNSGVVINPGQPRIDNIQDTATTPVPVRQVQFTSADTGVVNAVNGILANPENYYYNVHTSDNPNGAIRGQLNRVEIGVFIGLMSASNEVPPIAGLNATAVGSVVVLRARNSAGAITSGYVIFDVNYTGFPANPDGTLQFTGLHVHTQRAGFNGNVTLDSVLARQAVGANGSGSVHSEAEIDLNRAGALPALEGIFNDPQGYYINIHTTTNTGGAIRSQMRFTDRMVFQVTMNPDQEVPPIPGLQASAPASFAAHTIRGDDGRVQAGVAIFDVNPRFPDGTTFTAMHIHDGAAGANGTPTIDTRLSSTPILPSAGVGNIFRIVNVSTAAGLNTLNSLVVNPERQYINLHTSANTGGAVRAQLAPANTAVPAIGSIISGTGVVSATTAAPGAIMALFGQNLVKVGTDLAGFLPAQNAPNSINGTSVTVGGTPAALLIVSQNHLIMQVPSDAQAGSRQVVVTSANGESAAFPLTIQEFAPVVFTDAAGGLVVRNSNFQLIRPGNEAAAGDVLVIYLTGMGRTLSSLVTGRLVPLGPPFFETSAPTVTIGGRNATVHYSIASPGFAGLNQIGITMPTGVTPGTAQLTVRVGSATSNAVNLAVR